MGADLARLPRARLLAMQQAAHDLFDVLAAFAREGGHPVQDVLTETTFTTFTRYPDDGVGNGSDLCAWYYHAHDPTDGRPWEENGHFHCFAFTDVLERGAVPLALPAEPDPARGLMHLVALCVDSEGVPNRLFTLNRWASDEWLYPAADVIPLIDRFEVTNDQRFARTSRWLSAMLRVLQPQIAQLLQERDALLIANRATSGAAFSEDPNVEITSIMSFDLDAHLAAIDAALETA